jgi:hypothetical protein
MNENEHVRLDNIIRVTTNKKRVLKYKNGNEEILPPNNISKFNALN